MSGKIGNKGRILVGERVLARLRARGVDWLFANAGTDHAPLIEGLSRAPATGLDLPEAMVVAHEHVAVAMAHGAWLATGRPQAVLVHVNVGLANALMGIINAARDNVPMVILSGRTPITETARHGHRQLPIHWGQEMRDQGAMLREVVKWDYELRYGDEVDVTIDRAMAIAMSEPRGPVYLSLPREVLAEETGRSADPSPIQQPARPFRPDHASIEEVADLLAAAENPVLIAARSADAPGAEALAELAEKAALPVVEFWPSRLSLGTGHPMHGGFDPAPWLEKADLVLVLDAMVPWLPWMHEVKKGAKIVQIGADPLFSPMPIRGFPAHIALAGETSSTLSAIARAVGERTDGKRLAKRRKAVADAGKQREKDIAGRIREGARAPMTQAWASHCIGEAVRDIKGAAIVSELACQPENMHLAGPGSYFSHSLAGGLGWGVPAALGLKLADPDRLVIAATGDGSWLFANPLVCHQIAAAQNLPIVTILFNNGVWNAVRKTTGMMYPAGAALKANRTPLTSLAPHPDYVAVAKASGAWARRVEDGNDLPKILEKAIRQVTEKKRPAFVEIMTEA
ncbi:MAG: thiamine pyrophosphate-requiring protein [Geminicoccaceae bacterium]